MKFNEAVTIYISGANFAHFYTYRNRAAAEVALDAIRANGMTAYMIFA